jgi:hypothetical protein
LPDGLFQHRHKDRGRHPIPRFSYWLRVFRLIGLARKVLGLLILVLSPEPIYGPLFLGGSK